MSTLNVTTIQHESASGNNIVLDSDGNVEIAEAITAADDSFRVYSNGSVDLYRETTTGTNGLLTLHSDVGGTREQKVIFTADGSIEAGNTITATQLADNSASAFEAEDANGTRFQVTGAGEVNLYNSDLDETISFNSANGNVTATGHLRSNPVPRAGNYVEVDYTSGS